MARYFECIYCGQVVQGWNASQDLVCCSRQDGFHWREIDGPYSRREVDDAHAEALREKMRREDDIFFHIEGYDGQGHRIYLSSGGSSTKDTHVLGNKAHRALLGGSEKVIVTLGDPTPQCMHGASSRASTKEIEARKELIATAFEKEYSQEEIARWADNPDSRDLFNSMAAALAEAS